MSRGLNIALSDDIYNRLVESAEKLSLTKTGYVSYALRNMFDAEDNLTRMADTIVEMKILIIQLDDRIRKLNDMSSSI